METSVLFDVSSAASAAQSALIFCTIFLSLTLAAKNAWTAATLRLPPGPWGVPFLGVLPFLGKKRHITIQKWWEKYGNVYSMYMGSRLVIVINGLEAMKECFVKQADVFSARPDNYFKRLTQNTGIVFTEGRVWQEHRRFTLSCLRDFGMGRVSLEAKVHEETRILLEKFRAEDGNPFDVRAHLPKAISNIICSIIYGSRFDYDDPVFQANIQALDFSVRNQSLTGMIQFIPALEIVPKLMPKDATLAHSASLRTNYAAHQLRTHRETLDEDNPRDYIDAYLGAMAKRIRNKESTTFEEKHLKRAIQDLFIAGTETTNTTLKWSLLFMALNTDVQRGVQAEIERVIGSSRLPTMKDKPEMVYTHATIMECQRVANIALFSVPRCATRATKLLGHDIPKNAWVFVNRWGMHASTKYWNNPRKFDPTRFIRDGKIHKPEHFVPFGIGPRNCLGENLAKMELFLFFTSILQAFSLSVPDASAVSLEPVPGINMSPAPYNICMTQR